MKSRILNLPLFLEEQYKKAVLRQQQAYRMFNQVEINAITSLIHGIRNVLKPIAYAKLLSMYLFAAGKRLVLGNRDELPGKAANEQNKETPEEVVQPPQT